MKISVIIPAFNEEKYIGKCLESLKNQEEPPFEIIVVNNGSSDKTAQIAKSFGAIVLDEKIKGIRPARDTGFNAAKGDILARTDADTIVPFDWTKSIRRAFENDETLLGLSGSAHFYGFPSILQINNWLATGSSGFVKFFMGHDGMLGFNLALRKEVWETIKDDVCLEDSAVHEDADLAIHIARRGKVLFDKKIIVDTSSRRLKNIPNVLEYLFRGFKTINYHKGKNAH